jgi:hypothetical protein
MLREHRNCDHGKDVMEMNAVCLSASDGIQRESTEARRRSQRHQYAGRPIEFRWLEGAKSIATARLCSRQRSVANAKCGGKRTVNRIVHHDFGLILLRPTIGTATDFGILGGIKKVLAKSHPRSLEKARAASRGDVQ